MFSPVDHILTDCSRPYVRKKKTKYLCTDINASLRLLCQILFHDMKFIVTEEIRILPLSPPCEAMYHMDFGKLNLVSSYLTQITEV